MSPQLKGPQGHNDLYLTKMALQYPSPLLKGPQISKTFCCLVLKVHAASIAVYKGQGVELNSQNWYLKSF